eukprot:Sdes_comp19110_c0_seq1m9804
MITCPSFMSWKLFRECIPLVGTAEMMEKIALKILQRAISEPHPENVEMTAEIFQMMRSHKISPSKELLSLAVQVTAFFDLDLSRKFYLQFSAHFSAPQDFANIPQNFLAKFHHDFFENLLLQTTQQNPLKNSNFSYFKLLLHHAAFFPPQKKSKIIAKLAPCFPQHQNSNFTTCFLNFCKNAAKIPEFSSFTISPPNHHLATLFLSSSMYLWSYNDTPFSSLCIEQQSFFHTALLSISPSEASKILLDWFQIFHSSANFSDLINPLNDDPKSTQNLIHNLEKNPPSNFFHLLNLFLQSFRKNSPHAHSLVENLLSLPFLDSNFASLLFPFFLLHNFKNADLLLLPSFSSSRAPFTLLSKFRHLQSHHLLHHCLSFYSHQGDIETVDTLLANTHHFIDKNSPPPKNFPSPLQYRLITLAKNPASSFDGIFHQINHALESGEKIPATVFLALSNSHRLMGKFR